MVTYFRKPLQSRAEMGRVSRAEAFAKHKTSTYLGPNIFKTRRRYQRKANQKNICLWIGKGTQSVVIFLTCSIPQSQIDRFSIHHNICRVIIKTKLIISNLIRLFAIARFHSRSLVIAKSQPQSLLHCRNIFSRKGIRCIRNKN